MSTKIQLSLWSTLHPLRRRQVPGMLGHFDLACRMSPTRSVAPEALHEVIAERDPARSPAAAFAGGGWVASGDLVAEHNPDRWVACSVQRPSKLGSVWNLATREASMMIRPHALALRSSRAVRRCVCAGSGRDLRDHHALALRSSRAARRCVCAGSGRDLRDQRDDLTDYAAADRERSARSVRACSQYADPC